MKTKRNLFVVFTLLLFVTACEMSDPGELSPAQPDGALQPMADMPDVDEPERLLIQPGAASKVDPKAAGLILSVESPDERLKLRSITRTRQLGSSSSSARSNFEKSTLSCGAVKSGSTEDYGLNINDEVFYQRHGLRTDLEGNDRAYYVFVSEARNYLFRLSNATENLAMLLFKANITSPEENGNDIVTESTTALVAYSTSRSIRGEQLGPVFLEPGEYVLVIDSRPGKGSSFDLEMSCMEAGASCDGQLGPGLIAEDFSPYNFYRDITQVSSYWEDYYPGRGFPAQVRSYLGNKVLHLYRINAHVDEHENNIILSLGERNSGRYALEFDLGVFKGRSAYFNIQKVLTEQNADNEVGAELFFPSNGHAYVLVGGKKIPFNYLNGYWNRIKLLWDFDANSTVLYVNGKRQASWKATDTNSGAAGALTLEGINFYPAFNNSFWIMDDFCFSGN